MTRSRRARGSAAAVLAALVLGAGASCDEGQADDAPSPSPSSTATVEGRSRALLELQVKHDDHPGCIAAVGERGTILWGQAFGLADLGTGTPMGQATTFELASMTKQFTALSVLLLEADGRLSTADPVSAHLEGLPAWGDRVTLLQLVHHTGGVPEYFPSRRGGDSTKPLPRAAVDRTIRSFDALDFEPSSEFGYSNSGYVLLAEVVEAVSGQPFPDFVRTRVFEPLGLSMVVSPGRATPGLATPYERVASGFEPAGWQVYAMGATGARSDLADLVRWADDYRTGTVGGAALTEDQWRDAVATGVEDARAGAGIFRLPDGSLFTDGDYGGFRSGLVVSPDRQRSAVLLCNRKAGVEPFPFVRGLARIWDFR